MIITNDLVATIIFGCGIITAFFAWFSVEAYRKNDALGLIVAGVGFETSMFLVIVIRYILPI